MKCKITNQPINSFMTFGKMPIANGFLTKDEFDKEFFFDMEVAFSEKISLFQLTDHPKPEQMFNNNYPFFTGSSSYMIQHFKNYSNWIKKFLKTNSKLIEIGSNDGTFLSNFLNSSIKAVGIEPSTNVFNESIKKKIKAINLFFNKNIEDQLNEFVKSTDVICAANVICHIPDLIELINTLDIFLSKKGVFVFEEPYLGSMFEKTSYDQIYDEHIYMFSASSVKKIFNLFDYELIDVIKQETHGGSQRYVVGRKGQHDININVLKLLDEEKKANLDNIESCILFKKNCEDSKEKLKKKIKFYLDSGKKIVGYAATSKSTTILNYCNLGAESINCIYDTTAEKIGKFSPGKHIPIVSMKNFKKDNYDIVYLFAWNHKKEIFEKENSTNKNFKWISHVEL